jgi:transcriptional regulator with XRE-family HTH domain
VTGASPTVRQRELGMRLRKLRNERNLTDVEVANKLLCSATKISRIETGGRRPSLRDVRDLCGVYGVDPDTTNELMDLARAARQQGWWVEYDDLRIYFPFIGLEQDATAITCFGMYFVPALLQTADYAQALIKGIFPKIDPVVLGQRVEARMVRQSLLDRARPPRYRALLDEAVLRRQVGGAAVMKAQLTRILQLIEEGKATVQVIPFGVGAYAAGDSNFDYLEFADSPLPGLVFVEGLCSHLYLERPAELERYSEAVESLRDAALSPRESAHRIQEISNGYEDNP